MINIINDNKKNIKYQGKNLTQNCDIIKLKTKQIFAKKTPFKSVCNATAFFSLYLYQTDM